MTLQHLLDEMKPKLTKIVGVWFADGTFEQSTRPLELIPPDDTHEFVDRKSFDLVCKLLDLSIFQTGLLITFLEENQEERDLMKGQHMRQLMDLVKKEKSK